MLHDFSLLQNTGASPLLTATYVANVPMLSVLLSNGADINKANNYGETSLHVAVISGNNALITFLLSNGASINQADKNGSSPLHHAAENDHDAVVSMLVDRGADVNQIDLDGDRPIDVAKTQKIKDMLIALTEEKRKGEGQAAVPKVVDEAQWFRAANKGKLAVIQQGISDKIDVNCRDSEGRSALWWAAQKGHALLVEYLIKQHADLSIVTANADDLFWSIYTLTPLTSVVIPHVLILLLPIA